MKKIIMIAVCIAATKFLSAQASNVKIGIKAGVNVADLHITQGGFTYDPLASAYIGGLAHIHVSDHLAFQPELYFSGQGGRNGDQSTRLTYLNMPVLVQYMAGDGFRLQTGPQLGFLLAAAYKDNDGKVNTTDQMKTVDFSWAVGASYQFPGLGFGLDARYNIGLTDITGTNNSNVQNRVLSLGVFYQFMNAAHRH